MGSFPKMYINDPIALVYMNLLRIFNFSYSSYVISISSNNTCPSGHSSENRIHKREQKNPPALSYRTRPLHADIKTSVVP